MDDQGYWRVPGLTNFIKTNLRDGRMTKDTDGYLVLRILPSLPTEWTDNHGYQRVLGFQNIILNPTYGVDGRPRISIGTWSLNIILNPTGWTDEAKYW